MQPRRAITVTRYGKKGRVCSDDNPLSVPVFLVVSFRRRTSASAGDLKGIGFQHENILGPADAAMRSFASNSSRC